MAFLGSFLQYAVTFVVLVAIGVVGALIGVRLRKRKNAKLAQEKNSSEDETKEVQ